jgi:TPP-dependent pyruvate/acetoin dehydrogenase alpha subunit
MSKWPEQTPDDEADVYQILAPGGTLEGDIPDLSSEDLLEMYRAFVLTRAFEDKIFRMQRRGEISIITRSIGEEATPLGSLAALEPGDWCFPSYRQAAGFFYWDFPVERAIAFYMDIEPGTIEASLSLGPEADPDVNFAPVYVPLAANIPNAAGSAMYDAFTEDTDVVSLAYIGEGATSEGDFHEGLNFAGVFEAPVVTICQNNQWAISVPAERQTAAATFAQKAEAHGIPHERVDGNDVLAVYERTKAAVDRARRGEGPSLLECVTYRRGEHNSSDEPNVYRRDGVPDYWAERDPLDRFETYLWEESILSHDKIEAIEAAEQERVQEAADRVREIPVSDPEEMFANHLQGSHWKARHQRLELRAELAGENPFLDFTGVGLE